MSSTKFSQQGVTRARARFITQALSLEEHAAPGTVRSGVVFTTMLIAGFLLWSWSTEIAEAARAPGKVVPAGLVQKIQYLEGGLVENIHIRNGDRVEAGDALLSLAAESNRSELAQLGSRRADIALNLERVTALLEDREPQFDSFESFSQLHAGQRHLYQHQRAAQREQLALVEAQIAQREDEITSVHNQIKAIQSELGFIDYRSRYLDRRAGRDNDPFCRSRR